MKRIVLGLVWVFFVLDVREDQLGPTSAQSKEQVADIPTLSKPPELIELVPANVPEGTRFPAPMVEVLLEIDVDREGRVTEVRVLQGPGEPFDTAALKAARAFSFRPALLTNGQSTPVTITFRLRIEKPPPPQVPTPKPELVRFEGYLFERGTRKPLSGVDVRISSDKRTLARAVTDTGGRFELGLPVRSFRLIAVPVGHKRLDVEVVMEPGEQRREKFYLESLGTGFATVVRADRVRREVAKQIIQKSVVQKVAGTQGDTLKVVQNFPGVARAPFLSGVLILRGSSPGDSQVLLEGQEIPILYHFGVLRSTFNSAFLEAVEFVPGNFGPEYGRAIGGVVDVRVRDPAVDMFRGEADINLYDAGFLLEGPLSEEWTIGGAFHRSWVDTFLSAVLPEDAPLTFDTAPRYYDYQLIANWRPDTSKKFRTIFFGSLDKLELLLDRPQDDPKIRGSLRGRIMFHNFQLGYEQRFSPWLSQESSVQIGYQEFDTEIGPELFFDLRVIRFSFRTNWSLKRLSWLTVDMGMDIRLDRITIDLNSGLRPIEGENLPPISTRQVFGYQQTTTLYQPAAYLQFDFKLMADLHLLPSLRIDYYDNIRRWTLDPRLVVRYQILPGTVIKGGVGYYQQPPTPDQVVAGLGNPDLLAPRSSHSSLGVKHKFIEGLEIELTGFYKWLDRQVIRNPIFFVDPNTVAYLNGGTGRILGLELLIQARLKGFSGWLAYTFQRSYRKDGSGKEERLFDFDQPHILTLVANYEIGLGWSAGLRFRLVSGRPDTPVVGSVYDSVSGVWVPIFGKTNSERLPTFQQLDVRVDKTWIFDLWRLGVYLELLNTYNHPNAEGWQYNFDYSERGVLTGLPILPVLGVRGEW